jgi:hypothetical protein
MSKESSEQQSPGQAQGENTSIIAIFTPLINILITKQKTTEKTVSSLIKVIWAFFSLIAGIIIFQAFVRYTGNPNFIVVNGDIFSAITITCFGTVATLLATVLVSSWIDKGYIDAVKEFTQTLKNQVEK